MGVRRREVIVGRFNAFFYLMIEWEGSAASLIGLSLTDRALQQTLDSQMILLYFIGFVG